MVVVEEQDYYYSDSDSDDEDVDRYVFLARQPAPAGRHTEDDNRDASSENDDDDDGDDGTEGEEEESEGGVRRAKKRPLREIMGDEAPPPTKKARLELILASPLAAQTPPSGSESSSPRAGESGSDEGSHEKAQEHRAPREQGEDKNATKKKRAACGKRSRSPAGGKVDGDRDGVAAAAATKTAGASSSGTTAALGRFPCSLCDRCFDSHQALGGHVLGHRKRTKIAIAAGAIILDAVDAGEESAAVAVTEEAAKSIAQADKKVLVVARRGKANGGDGSSDEGKTVDDAAEHGDEDVDRARHKRQRKVHGKGNGNGGGVREPVSAGSHVDANGDDGFVNKGGNTIGVSGHGFTDGNSRSDGGKMDIGTASPNRKVGGAGTCHEGANGNVYRTRYKCKVCGTECFSGRALGGHMRKHRKRPPVGGVGGGEARSPSPATTDDDCQIPLAKLFGAETSLQRERDKRFHGPN